MSEDININEAKKELQMLLEEVERDAAITPFRRVKPYLVEWARATSLTIVICALIYLVNDEPSQAILALIDNLKAFNICLTSGSFGFLGLFLFNVKGDFARFLKLKGKYDRIVGVFAYGVVMGVISIFSVIFARVMNSNVFNMMAVLLTVNCMLAFLGNVKNIYEIVKVKNMYET